MTLAAVDRLVHHSTIFEMNVESYRRRIAVGVRHTNQKPQRHQARQRCRAVPPDHASDSRRASDIAALVVRRPSRHHVSAQRPAIQLSPTGHQCCRATEQIKAMKSKVADQLTLRRRRLEQLRDLGFVQLLPSHHSSLLTSLRPADQPMRPAS